MHYYVPLGLGNWLRKRGVTRYSELDWWQSAKLDDLTITSVPARHWSMRTPWDRNRSLWCGWVVASSELRFWFSGDSGVSPSLAEIATRLGPIDAAALPIGAFAPRWFMSQSHMDPQASVALWQALERPVTIPMHWAVFELTDEALDEPPQELARALAAAGEQADDWRFSPRRIGEFIPLVK